MLPVGTFIVRAVTSTSCAPLIAQTVRVAGFCLCEYSVMLRYIDKASLDVAVRCDPRTVQVLGYSISKVPSFGPREQFLTRSMLAARTPFTAGWI